MLAHGLAATATMSTLSARHGWTIRKDDALACSCQPPNPRHASGTQCFTRAQVSAFKAKHGIKSDGLASALMFIETFAPIERGTP